MVESSERDIQPALKGLIDLGEGFCTTWAHLEDGKRRCSWDMAETDNNQLLFTISPSEWVRDEGEGH